MLSTSSKTKFQYQYLLIAVLILAIAIAIAVFQAGAAPKISVGQSATQNLTTLSAADVSAYRWEAVASFYDRQASSALSAADASDYRWEAMAKFYAGQASPAANLSWPARPDFSILNETVAMPAFHYTAPGR